MARQNATNFTGGLQFPYANAATDLFKKEDVQVLAQAVDQHDHSTGKGLVVNLTSVPAGSVDGSKLTDGTVTSAKIQDGTIATADLANTSVTNAKLATDTARLSLLCNGGFSIWQRGNGPYSLSAGAWTADRWVFNRSGTDTITIQRDTANADAGSQYCMSAAYTRVTGGSNVSQPITDQW